MAFVMGLFRRISANQNQICVDYIARIPFDGYLFNDLR